MELVDLRGRTQFRCPESIGGGFKCLLQLTPGCRLRSLRSLRPTLAWSRHLLRDKGANAAPWAAGSATRNVSGNCSNMRGGPSWAA
jgi:hypothetical protein